MGNFAFLTVLAMLAVILFWYALQAEKKGRGTDGWLGIGQGDDAPRDKDGDSPLSPREKIRAKSRRKDR